MHKVIILFRLMRPKQWIKNGFVLVPLFFGGLMLEMSALKQSALVFVVFCLLSSAVYVINDIRDRHLDAQHPKKKTRPLASGAISPAEGVVLLLVLLSAVTILSAPLSPKVCFVFLVYFLINVSYSFGLKHFSLLELFLLSSGFVLRLLAGGFALNILLSNWLISMVGVVALFIAVAKRRGEMAENYDPNMNRKSLTGYNLAFLDSLMSILAGMIVTFYMLFAVSEYGVSRYGSQEPLLTVPVVAFGVFRFMQLAKVYSGADDPTELILNDRGMVSAILLFALLYAYTLYSN